MQREAYVVLAILLAGCVAQPAPEPGTHETSKAGPTPSPQMAAEPGPVVPLLSLDLTITKSDAADGGHGRVSASATARNIASENVSLWWPPCGWPLAVGLRDASGQTWTQWYDACQRPPAGSFCRDPCEPSFPPEPEKGVRELAPGGEFSTTYEFAGWVRTYDNAPPHCLPPGEYHIVARARWFGQDGGGVTAERRFAWTAADAAAVDAHC